ncbi:MAG: response regulator [Pseudomonadales bacterium]|nr:response regulator [Pseudomonadales bacterium]
MRILVVDDQMTMRQINMDMLSSLGYKNLTEADDGTTALALINQREFDLIVTDWNMPGMQGIDLLKAIRAHETYSGLPVILVTAEAKRDQIVEAAQAGVNGYVVKPFNAAKLKETLDKVVARMVATG